LLDGSSRREPGLGYRFLGRQADACIARRPLTEGRALDVDDARLMIGRANRPTYIEL